MAHKQPIEGTPTFLIWDSDSIPPFGDCIVVLWRSFNPEGSPFAVSIPKVVEENADTLRERFLGWLYEFGETSIDGIKLVDHLALRPGFSYWWMTLLAEKSYGKSTRCFDAIKLIALEMLSLELCPCRIVLVSNDGILAETLRLWCVRTGYTYEKKKAVGKHWPTSPGDALFRHRLPQPVQALGSLLAYVRHRWIFRQSAQQHYQSFAGAITVVDYLFHLAPEAVRSGVFASNYWGGLVDEFNRHEIHVNWLHHYVKQGALPSANQAADLLSRFNRSAGVTQTHSVFDIALGMRPICRALKDYARLLVKGFYLRKPALRFGLTQSNLNFWPLFKADWENSIFGSNAILNCLSLNLFEHVLENLPKQELGIYLQEHQGWEPAFVFAWRRAGHGRLVGVPHSTIRFWDLRYFMDSRSLFGAGCRFPPSPDQIALNGPAAINAMRKGAIAEEKLVEVEALRYLYLLDLQTTSSSENRITAMPLRVLVLGDYLFRITHQQMKWIALAASILPCDTHYVIRPHPNCLVDPADFPNLRCTVSDAPLSDLFRATDVVFTGNITSAAVDAYLARVPVVSMIDGETPNMSPLRGLKGVFFVADKEQLAAILAQATRNIPDPDQYFFLDRELPRWRHLLGGALSRETNKEAST
jgi:surface carbohydrate biosynthesis protein (TIGR04326 family)